MYEHSIRKRSSGVFYRASDRLIRIGNVVCDKGNQGTPNGKERFIVFQAAQQARASCNVLEVRCLIHKSVYGSEVS